MKIQAKGLVSKDPFVASKLLPKTSFDVVKMDTENIKKIINGQKTQGQNIKTPFNFPVALPSESPQLASQQNGGATYPVSPEQFAVNMASIPSRVDQKLSDYSYLAYSYSYDFVAGFLPNSPTPVDIVTDIYLTIGTHNGNFAYEFAESGFTVDDKTKWIVWNSFPVGKFIFDTSFSTPGNVAVYNSLTNRTKISGVVNWSNPLENRPVDSDAGFGSGILNYDFINTDPSRITQDQYNSVLNGNVGSLFFSFGLRVDNLTAGQQSYLLALSQSLIATSSIRFFGSADMANFN